MKKITLLAALLITQITHAQTYAPEINALRDRERIYVDEASDKLEKLHAYKQAWMKLGSALSLIAKGTPPKEDFNSGISPTRRQIMLVAHEQATVQLALMEMEISQPLADEAFDELDRAARDLPELQASTDSQLIAIRRNFSAAKVQLHYRRQRAEEKAAQWVDWQVKEHVKARIQDQQQVLSELEFSDALWQIRTPATLAYDRALSAIQEDNYDEAKAILSGLIFMRAAAPAFIAGRITSPERAGRLQSLLNEISRKERELTSLLAQALLAEHQILYASMNPSAAGIGASVLRLMLPVPKNLSVADLKKDYYTYKDKDGREILIHERQKSLMSYGTYLEFNHGYIQLDPPKINLSPRVRETIPIPSGEKLRAQVKKEVSKKIAEIKVVLKTTAVPRSLESSGGSNQVGKLGVGIDTPPAASGTSSVKSTETLQYKIGRLREMVEKSKADTPDANDRQELASFEKDIERFQQQQQYFETALSTARSAVQQASQAVSRSAVQLNAASQTHPDLEIPGDPSPASEIQASDQLSAAIADLVLGSVPGVGNVYNFTNFVTAIATGKTVLNQPVTSNLEFTMLAVGTILPFMGKIPKAAQALVRYAKISIARAKASRVTLTHLRRRGNDVHMLNTFIEKALKPLSESQRLEFDGKPELVTKLYGVLIQAQRADAKSPGKWFTYSTLYSPEQANKMLNIFKWGNNADKVAIYAIKNPIAGYYGKVANGTGTQLLINVSKSEQLLEFIELVETVALR